MPDADSAGRDSNTIGAYLKGLRESRGVSLDDVSKVTRIGKNYLAAIESDLFDKLPNQAYVKGFLRVYASYLGVDGDAVIAHYERDKGQVVAAGPEQHNQSRSTTAPPQPGRRPVRWFLPFGLLLILVLVALLTGKRTDTPEKLSTAEVPAGKNVEQGKDPRQPIRSTSSAAPIGLSVKPLVTTPLASETPAQGLVLRLKVNQDSWLHLTIDESISQQYDLKAGDIIEWKADRQIALDVGNAGGVEGECNGKPLQPFGPLGKPAHLVLKADAR